MVRRRSFVRPSQGEYGKRDGRRFGRFPSSCRIRFQIRNPYDQTGRNLPIHRAVCNGLETVREKGAPREIRTREMASLSGTRYRDGTRIKKGMMPVLISNQR